MKMALYFISKEQVKYTQKQSKAHCLSILLFIILHLHFSKSATDMKCSYARSYPVAVRPFVYQPMPAG